MKISWIKISLLILGLAALYSCSSVEELAPFEDAKVIDEALLEPLDFASDPAEELKYYTLMDTTRSACKHLGRVRIIENEANCSVVIQLRRKRFISPVNIEEMGENIVNGRFVMVGLERAESADCDRGTPAYVTCIRGFDFEKQIKQRKSIALDRNGGR